MGYFTYLIDNYDNLPSTIAFLHAHRNGFLKAWHTDTPLHDNVYAMQHLQIDWVQQNGYVNLRCKWNPGCKKSQRQRTKGHITSEIWQSVFNETSTCPPRNNSSLDDASLSQNNPSRDLTVQSGANPWSLPDEIGVACCAQFVVSRDHVLRRPKEDYIRFRRWVLETDLNDAKSGRVMEYLWHIIFGMDSVYCPDEKECYCRVYGFCD